MAERKEKCPKCGKWFVDLDNHKVCHGGRDYVVKRKDGGKDQCPKCGKWFVDLDNHKVCHGGRDYAVKRKDGGKDQCPKCGKWFVDLDNHKVCHGGRDYAVKRKDEEKDQCPKCGKWFVDLDNHKVCHGGRNYAVKRKDEGKDQCPKCGKWFVDLDNHKVCHGGRDYAVKRKDEEKDQCPKCGKWFVDLDNHKVCHGGRDYAVKRKDEEKDQCPKCGKWFVDLDNHKVCHGGRDYAVKRKDEEKDQCPKCGKWFVDLDNHKVCHGGRAYAVKRKDEEKDQYPKWHFRSYSSSRTKIDKDTIADLEGFVSSMVANGVIHHSRHPRSDIVNFFRDEVQLKQAEIETAAKHFNKLQDDVLEFLESRTPLGSWTAFRAGSYYDGTKVSRPNEMDCILFPHLPVHLEPVYSVPGFCKIKVVSPLDDIKNLCDGHFINKVKYRRYIFGIMDKFVKENSKGRTRCKKNLTHPSSPSFGVIYEGVSTDHGYLHIDVDFVPVLHVPCWPPRSVARDLRKLPKDISSEIDGEDIMEDGFNLVTTNCPGSHADQDLLWKVSCSNAEKKLTLHGENKRWKPVLRTMKRVVEIAKGIEGLTITGKSLEIQKAAQYTKDKYLKSSDFRLRFSTYYIRSLMWSLLYDLTAGNSVWRDDTQVAKLHFSLDKLRKMITGELVVPNFFIPGIRDIMTVRAKDREFMYILVRATEIIFSRSRDRYCRY